MKRRISLIVFVSVWCLSVQAQQQVEMADAMRSEGKIYVVVAIMLVIFAGLIAYLFRLDRKIQGIERQLGNKAS